MSDGRSVVLPPRRTAGIEAVCIGETMAMLTPVDAQPLLTRPALAMEIGGAESNVACGLAALGHATAWVSRLGDDPFGQIISEAVRSRGVDVQAVEIDPSRPTGLYLKDPGPSGTTVHYYRRGSAASALGPDLDTSPLVDGARLVHLSGITPVLSDTCAALVDALLVERRHRGPVMSFDVNHRRGLWSAERAAAPLLRLARAADVVLVGRDEAEALWGARTAAGARRLMPDVPVLVVKDGEHGATSFEGPVETFVPAPRVDVLEPVGAGDAFAAGYLSGLLDGRDAAARLRLGHLVAAVTLRCIGDLAELPPRAEFETRMAYDDAAWRTLRYGAVVPPAPGHDALGHDARGHDARGHDAHRSSDFPVDASGGGPHASPA